MKVRYEAKVTRGFSLSPRRFATRCPCFAARSLVREENFQVKPLCSPITYTNHAHEKKKEEEEELNERAADSLLNFFPLTLIG